jgi:hypothetical protein
MRRLVHSPAAWALLAAALCLGWQSLTVQANYGGNWTGLFRTGRQARVPPALEAGTFRNAHPQGYDGQFYRYLARDPFLRRGTAEYLDAPALRARRILVPLLAWLLAAGSPRAADAVYILIIAASVFAGVWWTSRLALHHGRRAAWGLLFLAVPTTAVAMDSMTVDVTLAALAACFAWQVQTGNTRWLWLTLTCAGLTRETGLLLPAAAAAASLWRRRPAEAALRASAMLPALAWYVYLQQVLPPPASSWAAPVPGWIKPTLRPGILARLFDPPAYPALAPGAAVAVRWLDRFALSAVLGASALAAAWAWRLKSTPLALALLSFAALVPAITSPGFWEPVYGYSRLVSPLFVLLAAVALGRPGLPPPRLAALCCAGPALRIAAEMWTQFLGIVSWAGKG